MRALRVATVLAAVASAGCGGGQAHESTLVWAKPPTVYRPADLPRDRVLLGAVRNSGARRLVLRARQVSVRDAGGRKLDADARFTTGYAHSVYGAFQQPDPLPEIELVRLGLLVAVAPGKTVPVNINYRLPPGARLPVTVAFADHGRLVVPVAARVAGRRP